MKVKNIILVLLVIYNLQAQNNVTSFNTLLDGLVKNYKLRDNITNAKIIQKFKVEQNDISYYPQVSLTGQMTYQNDVTKIPISLPGMKIPTMDKDQYKIALEVNQIIYDASLTSVLTKKDMLTTEIEEVQAKLNLTMQKDILNKWVYFYLINHKTKIQLLEQKKILEFKLKDIENLISGGILSSADLDNLKIEIIKIDQQIDAINIACNSIKKNIELLTGIRVSNEIIYEEDSLSTYNQINRDELKLFELRGEVSNISAELYFNNTLPKFYAFGQVGYGKPGFNMLSDKFSTFYIVGVRLAWNIFDWGKANKEKEIAKITHNSINNEKELFLQNIQIQQNELLSSIEKIDKWLLKDEQIISLRDNVLSSTNSKLMNGVAKTIDYLNDLNAKTQSVIDYEKHKIEKQYYIQSYKILLGIK